MDPMGYIGVYVKANSTMFLIGVKFTRRRNINLSHRKPGRQLKCGKQIPVTFDEILVLYIIGIQK